MSEEVEVVFTLENGVTIYRKKDVATSSYVYYSDEVPSGVMVWHSGLVGADTVLTAVKLHLEQEEMDADTSGMNSSDIESEKGKDSLARPDIPFEGNVFDKKA